MSDQWQDPYAPPQIPAQTTGTRPQVMPVPIKVFGILNLIMAAWGLLGTCFALVPLFVNLNTPNPVLDMMKENEFYYSFNIFATILGFVLIGMLAAAGIGLLKNRSWGRSLSVLYAVITIVLTIVSTVLTYIYLVQPLMEKAAEMAPGPEKITLQGSAIGGLAGGCIGLIYPIVLWIFMTRPRIVQALRQASDE
jgi:hypothetical protein